ncbi:hypothetical protein [Nonomuraea sp. NPDC005650]|uniref:hypothetical protein n=1 Tax=Nonomuraea sp. NPDC005650 TaxID=3157045 RepID=UPI0033BE4232
MISSTAYAVNRGLLSLPAPLLRRSVSKESELLVLRHQNAILRRQVPPVRYELADHLWLAARSHLHTPLPTGGNLPPARLPACPAHPWDYSNRRRPGRPSTAAAVKALILRMAAENPRWGHPGASTVNWLYRVKFSHVGTDLWFDGVRLETWFREVLLSLVYRLVRGLFGLLVVLVRADLSKDVELPVLRQENQVLRRQLGDRPRWGHADRLWLAALSRLIHRPRWAEVFPVTPATIVGTVTS